MWEALEQRVIVQPAGGGSYLDCLTCSSGSPTKRLLQVTDIDPGRWIDVPAISYFDLSLWRRAKPRTLLTNFFGFDDLEHVLFTVVAIWPHGYLDFTIGQN